MMKETKNEPSCFPCPIPSEDRMMHTFVEKLRTCKMYTSLSLEAARCLPGLPHRTGNCLSMPAYNQRGDEHQGALLSADLICTPHYVEMSTAYICILPYYSQTLYMCLSLSLLVSLSLSVSVSLSVSLIWE